MASSSKPNNVTISTAVDSPNSSPTHSRRQGAPKGLDISPTGGPTGKLGLPISERPDFPSPGTAPQGQRIFDANAVAEDKGVETVPGGWAHGPKEQEKLQDEYAQQDETAEKLSLKEKVKNLLHKD